MSYPGQKRSSGSPYRSFQARPITSYGPRRADPPPTTYQSRTLPGFAISGNALKPSLPSSALHKRRPITARLSSTISNSLRGSRDNVHHPLRRVATARRVKSARPPLGRSPFDKTPDTNFDNQAKWITITKYNKEGQDDGLSGIIPQPSVTSSQKAAVIGHPMRGSTRNTETASSATSFLPQVPVVIVTRAGLLTARPRMGEEDPEPVKPTVMDTAEDCRSVESLHATSDEEEAERDGEEGEGETQSKSTEWAGGVKEHPDAAPTAELKGSETPSEDPASETPFEDPAPEPPSQWAAPEPDLPTVSPSRAPTAAVDPSDADISVGFSAGTPSTECERNDMIRERMTSSMTPAADPSPVWPHEDEAAEDIFLTSVPKESEQEVETLPEPPRSTRTEINIHSVRVDIDAAAATPPKPGHEQSRQSLNKAASKPEISAKAEQLPNANDKGSRKNQENESDFGYDEFNSEAAARPRPIKSSSQLSSRARGAAAEENRDSGGADMSAEQPQKAQPWTRTDTGKVRLPVASPDISDDDDEAEEQKPKRGVKFADAGGNEDENKESTATQGVASKSELPPIRARPRTSRVSSARGRRVTSIADERQEEPTRYTSANTNDDSQSPARHSFDRQQKSHLKEPGLDTLAENPNSPDPAAKPLSLVHEKRQGQSQHHVSARPTTSRPRTGRVKPPAPGSNDNDDQVDEEGRNATDTNRESFVGSGKGDVGNIAAAPSTRLSTSRPVLIRTSAEDKQLSHFLNDADSIPDDTNSEASDLDTTHVCVDHYRFEDRPKTSRPKTKTSLRRRSPSPAVNQNDERDTSKNDLSIQPTSLASRIPLSEFSNRPMYEQPHYNSPTEQFTAELKARPRTATAGGPASLERHANLNPVPSISTKRPSTGSVSGKQTRKSSAGKIHSPERSFADFAGSETTREKMRPSTGKGGRSPLASSGRPKTGVSRNKSKGKQRGLPPGSMTVVLSVANILLGAEDDATSRVKEFQNRILKFYTAILREETLYKRRIAQLPEFENIRVQAITLGSLKLHCQVQTRDALDRLEKSYLANDLAEVLTTALITPAVLAEIGVRNMHLVADIDRKEIMRCKHDLAAQGRTPSLSVTGRPPAMTRSRSDSSIGGRRRASVNSSEISLESSEFLPRSECLSVLREGAQEFGDGVNALHSRYTNISAGSKDFMMTLKLVKPVQLKEFKYLADVIAVYNYLEASPSVGKSLPTRLVDDFLAIVNLSHQYLKDITAKVRTLECHMLKYIPKDSVVDFYRKILDFRDLLDPSFMFASIDMECPVELSIMDGRLFSKLICYLPYLLANMDELVARLDQIKKEMSLVRTTEEESNHKASVI